MKLVFFLPLNIQQGLYIRYRDLGSDTAKYDSVTVMKPDSEMHDVANLNKFSKYEFFISPFYRTVEGQPSNSKIVQTLEDGESKEQTLILGGCRSCLAKWIYLFSNFKSKLIFEVLFWFLHDFKFLR